MCRREETMNPCWKTRMNELNGLLQTDINLVFITDPFSSSSESNEHFTRRSAAPLINEGMSLQVLQMNACDSCRDTGRLNQSNRADPQPGPSRAAAPEPERWPGLENYRLKPRVFCSSSNRHLQDTQNAHWRHRRWREVDSSEKFYAQT